MGARLVVTFCDENKKQVAHIYDHWSADNKKDAKDVMEAFFDEVGKQCTDTRFTDASYLAAKFLVWRAIGYAATEQKYSKTPTEAKPLNFLSLGIVSSEQAMWAECLVRVMCTVDGARPTLVFPPRSEYEQEDERVAS